MAPFDDQAEKVFFGCFGYLLEQARDERKELAVLALADGKLFAGWFVPADVRLLVGWVEEGVDAEENHVNGAQLEEVELLEGRQIIGHQGVLQELHAASRVSSRRAVKLNHLGHELGGTTLHQSLLEKEVERPGLEGFHVHATDPLEGVQEELTIIKDRDPLFQLAKELHRWGQN